MSHLETIPRDIFCQIVPSTINLTELIVITEISKSMLAQVQANVKHIYANVKAINYPLNLLEGFKNLETVSDNIRLKSHDLNTLVTMPKLRKATFIFKTEFKDLSYKQSLILDSYKRLCEVQNKDFKIVIDDSKMFPYLFVFQGQRFMMIPSNYNIISAMLDRYPNLTYYSHDGNQGKQLYDKYENRVVGLTLPLEPHMSYAFWITYMSNIRKFLYECDFGLCNPYFPPSKDNKPLNTLTRKIADQGFFDRVSIQSLFTISDFTDTENLYHQLFHDSAGNEIQVPYMKFTIDDYLRPSKISFYDVPQGVMLSKEEIGKLRGQIDSIRDVYVHGKGTLYRTNSTILRQ